MLNQLFRKRSNYFYFSTKAFEALRSKQVQKQILSAKNAKLDALFEVILSLNNKQLTYLNQLQSKIALQSGKSILHNKIYSQNGSRYTPLQYVHQTNWIKKSWKQSHLLTSVLVNQDQQDSGKDEEQVVKQIWQIELTSVDPSQKIKIIKVLRQMFNLGLKQAKQIADKTPSLIIRQRKDQAQKIKQTLQKQGCVITLK